MATVYLARDQRHGRQVALKLLHPEFAVALGPERFLREIVIAARLQHPNVLPLFDSGNVIVDGGAPCPYYVMPYVAGQSLRARLERETELGLEESVAISRQVASALSHAHAQGIIHRDIKPENILLDEEGRALVADFGIAQALDLAGAEKLTATGLSLGTPTYMSPEQASAGHVDARADVYSLACVLYEMLAGTPPFTGSTARAIAARHALDSVPPLRSTRPEISPQLEAVVQRALAKVPGDRFDTAEEFAHALEAAGRSESTKTDQRIRYRAAWIAVPVALLAAAGLLLARRAPRPVVLPSAATIAVLPVFPSSPDTLLARLGRDLAVTIAANIDGVGEIRTVDRLSIAAATADARNPLSLEESAKLARRYGAASVLRGTLVRVGANVRVDLGLFSVDRLEAMTGGLVATAPLDSVGQLTDSLTWALVRQIWQQGEPPTASLTAVTTRSVPALRAFLDGERALVRNHWHDAAVAYRSALAADSTFWLAHQRYAETQTWVEQEIEPEVLDRLALHREALPERDRLLADAILSAREPSATATMGLYEEVTRRFPDYWPGWFLYADRLVHGGGLLGYPWTRARDALQRALDGNPNLVPAWQHLYLISIGRDTVIPARSVSRLAELGFFDGRAAQEQSFRLGAELSRYEGVLPEALQSLADSVARLDASAEMPQSVRMERLEPIGSSGFPKAQIAHNRRMLALGVNPEIAAAIMRSTARAWAARGAWDSALVASDSAAVLDPSPSSAFESYRLSVLGAWVGTLDPSESARRRRFAWLALERLPASPPPISTSARLHWLDGVLAYARGDRAGIARARQALRERLTMPNARAVRDFNDRSLAALELALDGDQRGAGLALAALEWECAGLWACPMGNYDAAVHHLAGAQWLLAAGDTAQAVRLLVWHEAFQGGSPWSGTVMLTPLAYLELARIQDARGLALEAREHYKQFLRRYDAPMPPQRHLVEEARQAVARLSGLAQRR